MTRDQLAHILRAAARIVDDSDIVVFGSQAILASFRDQRLPPEAIYSIEADVTFFDDPDDEKSDRVDGAIGELSQFHESFGIYAQGVSITTAVLPAGWRNRIVVFKIEGETARGLCLEPHDLVTSKLVAGRDKDYEFARALLRERLIDHAVLIERIDTLQVDPITRKRITDWLSRNR